MGQERAVAVLSRALAEGRASHAYLFAGPPQVGKATAAVEFAQALNCRGEDPPCHRCKQCHLIEEGKHPDIEVISIGGLCEESGSDHKDHSTDGSKEIRICQVRRLKRIASRAPFEGRYRVAIIDPADALNAESSNALLNLEAGAFARIILVTSREERSCRRSSALPAGAQLFCASAIAKALGRPGKCRTRRSWRLAAGVWVRRDGMGGRTFLPARRLEDATG
jgi:hypothetical protein